MGETERVERALAETGAFVVAVDPERTVEDGRWVVLGRLQIVKKDGGDELDVPLAHVLEQRDKKVASVTAYSEISAALESVGLPA